MKIDTAWFYQIGNDLKDCHQRLGTRAPLNMLKGINWKTGDLPWVAIQWGLGYTVR